MRRIVFIYTLAALFVLPGILFSEEVPMETAREYADQFMRASNSKSFVSSVATPFQQGEATYTYLVHYEPEGWILMSADDRVKPVLAYSHEGYFDLEEIKELPFYFWFDGYKDQIKQVVASKTGNRHPNWDVMPAANKSKSIEPLIKVKWNQNKGWNQFCPVDSAGPGGHAYAGCVAVAMAQNMTVYKHPTRGTGSKTSTASEYGALTANFGETNYKWDLMHPTSSNEHSALLLYHLGIAVDMGYGADGSGAFSRNVPQAIKNYFDYSKNAAMVSRNSYSESEWIELMIQELEDGRPIYYSGNPNNGEAGHAWNLDGSDGSAMFHMNWGWGGSFNGYFYLNALTPGSSNYSHNQQAVINFRPVNHWPVDILLSENKVEEGQDAGTVIGTFTVVDETPDDTHEFQIEGPESIFGWPLPVPFTIEENKLVTSEVLSHSTKDRYEIFVTATDFEGHDYKKNFFILITPGSSSAVSASDINEPETTIRYLPANRQIDLSLVNDHTGSVELMIYDVSGRRIQSASLTKNTRYLSHSTQLDGTLPAGIYMMLVNMPGKKPFTHKFVIAR